MGAHSDLGRLLLECGKQDVHCILCLMFKGLKMIEENHSQKGSFSLQFSIPGGVILVDITIYTGGRNVLVSV